ncbi:MAG TPA: cation:proton antiporter [Gemmatimonadales bacterium]|nr:cation:proton antiporter [Gemmatimonadales bacterium]
MDALPIPTLLLSLAAILIAAKLFGDLAERVKQPAVLGELVAGVLLGPSVFGVIPTAGPMAEILHVVAELGVILLLFEIGLETDLRELFRVGPAALAVAAVGIALPFLLGFGFWTAAPPTLVGDSAATAAIFVGATLTATSVGITARVLSDLGKMNTREARIILGAAIIDDVLGLVILTVVSGIAAGGLVSPLTVMRVLVIAVGFLVIAVVGGRLVAPRLFLVAERMRVRGVLVAAAVAVAFGLAGLAEEAGSAHILGAFAAGLVLSGTNQFDTIERELKPVVSIFAPVFFVVVGASVDLRLLDPSREGSGALLLLTLVLSLLAILGKVAAGWAAPWERYRRLVVGVGMIPRGEVGLIFANIGLRTGVIGHGVFSALLLMVMVSTFVVPPALKSLFSREDRRASS